MTRVLTTVHWVEGEQPISWICLLSLHGVAYNHQGKVIQWNCCSPFEAETTAVVVSEHNDKVVWTYTLTTYRAHVPKKCLYTETVLFLCAPLATLLTLATSMSIVSADFVVSTVVPDILLLFGLVSTCIFKKIKAAPYYNNSNAKCTVRA